MSNEHEKLVLIKQYTMAVCNNLVKGNLINTKTFILIIHFQVIFFFGVFFILNMIPTVSSVLVLKFMISCTVSALVGQSVTRGIG